MISSFIRAGAYEQKLGKSLLKIYRKNDKELFRKNKRVSTEREAQEKKETKVSFWLMSLKFLSKNQYKCEYENSGCKKNV